MTTGIDLLVAERAHQINDEGYTPEHDRGRVAELAKASASYAMAGACDVGALGYVANDPDDEPFDWPWHPSYWKPTGDAIRDLTKAGALIVAALDTLLAEAPDHMNRSE